MPKVTRNPLPAPLRPEDVAAESGVLRVRDVLVDVPSDKNRRGKVTVILTWEHEQDRKGMYLNAQSIDNAIAGFGTDQSEDWKDKEFPYITVRTQYKDRDSGKDVFGRTLWVAPPEQWATLLKAHKTAQREAKKAGK